MIIPAKHPLAQAFSGFMSGICSIVGDRANRGGPLAPLLILIYWRLRRTVARLDRIAQLWTAGTLPKPQPARATRPTEAPPAAEPAKPRPYVPGANAWLFRLAQRTAQYTGQFEIFLANPETQALVAAAPQAGRLLRPLCTMLGLKPPEYLRRPRRTPNPARPAQARPEPSPIPHAGRPRRQSLSRYILELAYNLEPAPLGPDYRASHVFRT